MTRISRGWSTLALLGVTVSATTTIAAAQGRLIGEAVAAVAPSFTSWRFNQPIANDSFSIRKVWQLTVPVSVSVALGRVTIDAGGAVALGRVGLEDGRSFELSGLTDLRVRGVARVIGDQLLLTVGLNAPVGATRLAGHEVDALGVLGSPALGFTTPTLGNGLGVTGGLVYAWRAGEWGLAIGSSFESRKQYAPIESQIAGVLTPADLKPGNALRFSLGADRLIGQGRLSLLLAGDLFGESRLSVSPPGGNPVDSRYKLGPQLSGALVVDLGVTRLRSFTIMLADRYRSKFTGFDGEKAEGSSGNVLEGAIQIVTGKARGAGLYLRADGRLDSGLEVDNTITTAAMTSGGLSVGIAVVTGRASILPFVRAQVGRLDTGPESTTAVGFGAGITLTVRP